MSLLHPLTPEGQAPLIKEGDLVILYERFDCMRAMTVTLNGVYNNRNGAFFMKEWIGKPFGCRVASKQKTGFMHILQPTAELWTLVLKHRTQILYLADIATVCCQLELKPGSIVLESGTGSGSLTHSLVRAVAPTGHVYTFEFHEQRSITAREEFEKNGFGELITVEQRNIELNGFPESLHNKADAVFLDLPGPWKAIPSVSKCLKPDGVFCGFSPCIEQVQKTCELLNEYGFKDFRTIEVLLREYEVVLDKTSGGGVEKLQELLEEQVTVLESGLTMQPVSSRQKGREKRQKLDQYRAQQQQTAANGGNSDINDKEEESNQVVSTNGVESNKKKGSVYTRPLVHGRGHTGYLTFARKAVDFEISCLQVVNGE